MVISFLPFMGALRCHGQALMSDFMHLNQLHQSILSCPVGLDEILH